MDSELLRMTAVFTGAIAADAIVLTVCDFRQNACVRRAIRWTLWVSLAHWGLAAMGISGSWMLRTGFPLIAPFVHGATILLLCFLIAQIVLQTLKRPRPVFHEGRLGFVAKVWIVSIDALFVGAGESAATGSWAGEQVLGTLVLLGPMILVCVSGAVVVARGVSRLVESHVIQTDTVLVGGAIGLPLVTLPILSFLVVRALREIQLV